MALMSKFCGKADVQSDTGSNMGQRAKKNLFFSKNTIASRQQIIHNVLMILIRFCRQERYADA